jgi:hypothetical protein
MRHLGWSPPQQVSWTQLWSSLLLCALQGMHSFADWRRLLGLQSIGPVAPVWLTRHGLVKRLLQAGLVPLQEVWEAINAQLAQMGSQTVPATLAAFAPEIFCLEETRLDALGRYLKPLRGLSAHDPACTAFKLVGLLDLRAQRWLRLQWREPLSGEYVYCFPTSGLFPTFDDAGYCRASGKHQAVSAEIEEALLRGTFMILAS